MSNGDLGLELPPVADLRGATAAIIGAMYRIWGVVPNRQRGSYIMQTDPYPITGSAVSGGTATGTVSISTSGAFVLTKHSIYADTLDFAVTWMAQGSDRRVTSRVNGGHVQNLGGDGEHPFIYPQPYIWDGGTKITATVESLTANSRSVYWDFIGWRIWDVAALDLTRRAM